MGDVSHRGPLAELLLSSTKKLGQRACDVCWVVAWPSQMEKDKAAGLQKLLEASPGQQPASGHKRVRNLQQARGASWNCDAVDRMGHNGSTGCQLLLAILSCFLLKHGFSGHACDNAGLSPDAHTQSWTEQQCRKSC